MRQILGGRVQIERWSALPGHNCIISVTLYRWEFVVQLPRFAINAAQVDDPDRPGDLVDWSVARDRRRASE